MASPSSPLERPEAKAESKVKHEDDDTRDAMPHANSDTAPDVQLPPTGPTGTMSGKRSAPSSPDENSKEKDDANDSGIMQEDGKTKSADAAAEATVNEPQDESTPPPAKRRTMCGVCLTEPSKYKCARCALA